MDSRERKGIFLTAIDTDAGKTFVSALLCKAFDLDYWKPIQCGGLDRTDSDVVAELIGEEKIHPEGVRLKKPASPHDAAAEEGVELSLSQFRIPDASPLLVEGAGGPMVPLNLKGEFVVDLAKRFDLPVVLVTNHYLGSINHTVLCIEVLRSRGHDLAGVIVNGEPNVATEEVYFALGVPVLAHIPRLHSTSTQEMGRAAEALSENKLLHELFQD